MSRSPSTGAESTGQATDSAAWVEANRAELRREAASDAPHAWVAKRVLQSVDGDS